MAAEHADRPQAAEVLQPIRRDGYAIAAVSLRERAKENGRGKIGLPFSFIDGTAKAAVIRRKYVSEAGLAKPHEMGIFSNAAKKAA